MNGLGPRRISDLLLCYEPSRPLRSSEPGLLSVPRVKTKHVDPAVSVWLIITATEALQHICSAQLMSGRCLLPLPMLKTHYRFAR